MKTLAQLKIESDKFNESHEACGSIARCSPCTAAFAFEQIAEATAELRAENERLREALEYYADTNHWHNGRTYRYDRVITGRAEHGYETAKKALEGK